MDLAGLKTLAETHDVDFNKFWGVDKMQEALIEAGVAFEPVEDDESPEPQEAVDVAPAAPPKKAGQYQCVVLAKNIHIQPRDMGRHDSGISVKFYTGDKFTLTNGDLAKSLAAQKRVTLV